MFDGAVNVFLLRIAPYIGSGLLVVILGLGVTVWIQSGQIRKSRDALKVEQALHETDSANFRAVQALANADWQAEMARVQTNNRRNNDEADRKVAATRTDYLARVVQLPSAASDPGVPGGSQMPGVGDAQGINGPGGDTVFLARADAAICATNTARLEAGHDWAMEMQGKP